MRKPSNSDSTKSSPGTSRSWLKYVLGGTLAVAVGTGLYYKDEIKEIHHSFVDANKVKGQNERLLSVKAFLEQNSEKMKAYSGLSPEGMAKKAPEINKILKELIEEMKKAALAAQEVGQTSVRFNPVMFEELEIAVNLGIRKLSPESNWQISQLEVQVGAMNRSQRGSGVYNWMVGMNGISPSEVAHMLNQIKELRQILIELKEVVTFLEQEQSQNVCSNNRFVSSALEDKFGKNHCDPSNRSFCKAIGLATDPSDIPKFSPVQAVAVQRELIRLKLLSPKADDGVFNKASQDAYAKAWSVNDFRTSMAACRIKP